MAGTIGGGKAGRTLDKILNEIGDKKVMGQAAKVINGFRRSMKGIRAIEDRDVKVEVVGLLHKDCIRKIDETGYPEEAVSYLKNVVAGMAKATKK